MTDDLSRRAQAHPGMCVYPVFVRWGVSDDPARSVTLTLDNTLGRFEPGDRIEFATPDGGRHQVVVLTDAGSKTYDLAEDEALLLSSIEADRRARRWYRRLARWAEEQHREAQVGIGELTDAGVGALVRWWHRFTRRSNA